MSLTVKSVSQSYSITVVKQLFEISLSCITYLRCLLPEENYEVRDFSGMTIKVLKRDFSKENTMILDSLDYGVSDAIEKRYLKEMVFAVLSDAKNAESAMECYHFRVDYPTSNLSITDSKGTVLSDVSNVNGVRRQIAAMIRSLVSTVQTLDALPRSCFLSIRLLYTEDTPWNYQPRFFKETDCEFKMSEVKVHQMLGNVKTPHHCVEVDVDSTVDFKKDNCRCVCGLLEDDMGMVECEKCGMWSHVVCYGYYHSKDPRLTNLVFRCHNCSFGNKETLKNLALLRTAVAVSWNEMEGIWTDKNLIQRIKVTKKQAKQLIQEMVNEGIAEFVCKKTFQYKILKENISSKHKVRSLFQQQQPDTQILSDDEPKKFKPTHFKSIEVEERKRPSRQKDAIKRIKISVGETITCVPAP